MEKNHTRNQRNQCGFIYTHFIGFASNKSICWDSILWFNVSIGSGCVPLVLFKFVCGYIARSECQRLCHRHTPCICKYEPKSRRGLSVVAVKPIIAFVSMNARKSHMEHFVCENTIDCRWPIAIRHTDKSPNWIHFSFHPFQLQQAALAIEKPR